MPAPLINENWSALLEPTIKAWFKLTMDRFETKRTQLFNVVDSTKDTEHYVGVGAVGIDQWNQYNQSGVVGQASFDQGYQTNLKNVEFPLELPIQRKLLDDAQYNNIITATEALADSASLKMETDAASVINNATSSSFLGADGVALASASHPMGPLLSGTQSNAGSLSITPANLETTRINMINFTDDKGVLVGTNPDTILVPPGLEYTARQSILSAGDPTTANRADNPRQGAYNIIVWNYLTTSTRWLMIDSVKMKRYLIWQDRVPINIKLKVMDTTLMAVYIAYMRYTYGWIDWRWCYVNN